MNILKIFTNRESEKKLYYTEIRNFRISAKSPFNSRELLIHERKKMLLKRSTNEYQDIKKFENFKKNRTI